MATWMHNEGDRLEQLIIALKNGDSAVRAKAAMDLGRLNDRSAVRPLVDAMEDPDEGVRSSATSALEMQDFASVLGATPRLIHLLQNENSEIRWRASRVLGKGRDRRAIEPLVAALKDRDSNVRCEAAEALARLDPGQTVERLIDMLTDEDRLVRWNAAGLLHEIGDRRATMPLIKALNDPSSEVRFNAAMALGKIGDERALLALQKVWQSDIAETFSGHMVSDAAREAIENIKKRL